MRNNQQQKHYTSNQYHWYYTDISWNETGQCPNFPFVALFSGTIQKWKSSVCLCVCVFQFRTNCKTYWDHSSEAISRNGIPSPVPIL